ncbi:cell envelope integrity protein TolA [Brucella cytisi]|uniref:TonB C-terminal domain-containing protein n=2 Tax=Brucella cytisi TaxID=407152 RepID=A0A1J6HMT4_9HYPH|nr:hypothetical protein BLA27_08750 [Brucella cytisi]
MSISESSKPKHKWTFRIPVTAWLILVPWILIWCAVIIWTITAGLMNAGVAGRLSAYVMVLAAPYLITWLLWLLFRRSQRVASIIFTSLLLIMAAVMVGPKLAEIGRQARQSETHNQISHPADSAEWQRKFRELVSPEIRVLTRSLKDIVADGETPSDRTIVDLKLARDGKLIEAKISQSSGVARLDEAALQMVREFEQLPKPSSDMLGDPVVLQLPIDFRTE